MTTEQQATPTSEEELRRIVRSLGSDCIQISGTEYESHFGERCEGAVKQLLAWRDAAVVEARVDELENLRQDWHSLYTVHKEVDERLDELTKARETPHEKA